MKAYRVTLGEVLSPLWGKLDAIEAKGVALWQMREVLGRHGVAMSEHRLRMFLMTRKLLVTWEYVEGSSLGEVEEKGSPGSVVETGLDFERIEKELGELEACRRRR